MQAARGAAGEGKDLPCRPDPLVCDERGEEGYFTERDMNKDTQYICTTNSGIGRILMKAVGFVGVSLVDFAATAGSWERGILQSV